MSTILSFTTMDLREEEKQKLCQAVIEDVSKLFTKAMAYYPYFVEPDNCRGDANDQITFFVCVPDYSLLEKKRAAIDVLTKAVYRTTGNRGSLKTIVLFQYHDDDGVGKDGELFSDILLKH